MIEEQQVASSHLRQAVEVVSAYVSNNSVPASELPRLIHDVHASLNTLSSGGAQQNGAGSETEIEKPNAAQIRKSITPNGLISFIDGKSYKTLKRHLRGHGMSPHEYCERYGLASDYPMVAASYSAARSELAKQIGLGVKSA